MIRRLILIALLPFAGCAAITAHQARDALIGMHAVDLQACAGVPDKVRRLDDRELLLEYDHKADTPALSLQAFSQFDLKIGAAGECHALFRILRSGTVTGVAYAATSAGLDGPYAACAPLIKECVVHPDRTTLPAGYDAFQELLPNLQK